MVAIGNKTFIHSLLQVPVMSIKNLSSYESVAIESKIYGASPLELIVIVYERLLLELSKTRSLLAEGREARDASERAIDLIQLGLESALNMEKGGEIAKNLAALYDWSVVEILKARARKDPEIISGVIRVFEELSSAWRELHQRQTSGETFTSSASVHLSPQAVQAIATP